MPRPNGPQFKTIGGERFKTTRHPDLQDPKHERLALLAEDGYGIENVYRGPRSVYDPSGYNFEDAENINHAVRIIQEHRAKKAQK
jgi:hypothetical protein